MDGFPHCAVKPSSYHADMDGVPHCAVKPSSYHAYMDGVVLVKQLRFYALPDLDQIAYEHPYNSTLFLTKI